MPSTPPLSRQCKACGRTFEKPYYVGLPAWEKRYRSCSRSCAKKGIPSWNKGLERWWEATGSFKKGHDSWNKGMKGFMANEQNGMWKGDEASMTAIHEWVKRRLGRPMTCQKCGTTVMSTYKIHWANKSGLYKRDLEDWMRLCVPCHKRYDLDRIKEAKTSAVEVV